MNYLLFALIGSLLVTSCDAQTNSNLPSGGSTGLRTNGVIENQEAIAKEIVSIEHAFGDAMLQFNNTNTVAFVTEVKSLTERLDRLSKEFDVTGTFPIGLREATLKQMDDIEKTSPHPRPLRPEDAKDVDTITSVTEKYISVWVSVTDKAGLSIGAKGEASGVDANNQGTKNP